MNTLQKVVLGFVQAILEWLPVSSQGFMILIAVNAFGETAEEALRIAIYFHLGTALAVLIKYREFYIESIFRKREDLRFLIYATVMTGVTGVPLYFLLRDVFSEYSGTIVTLLIGVTLLVTATFLRKGRLNDAGTLTREDRTIKDELLVGAVQGCAILPGISRSGSTLTFLILRGYEKEEAFHMSFVISLPAVLASIAFDILIEGTEILLEWDYFLVMGIVCVVGYLTMDLLLRMAKNMSFDKICYILGAITIILASIILAINPTTV